MLKHVFGCFSNLIIYSFKNKLYIIKSHSLELLIYTVYKIAHKLLITSDIIIYCKKLTSYIWRQFENQILKYFVLSLYFKTKLINFSMRYVDIPPLSNNFEQN